MAAEKKAASGRKKSTSTRSTSKAATEKSSGTKRAATRSTAKKESTRSSRSAPRSEPPRRPGAAQVAREAARQLLELTGKEPEGITGLERGDDGWTVHVEVLEVRRIPNTTDVLALYEVSTDDRGDLQSYRRVRRYARGVPGED